MPNDKPAVFLKTSKSEQPLQNLQGLFALKNGVKIVNEKRIGMHLIIIT